MRKMERNKPTARFWKVLGAINIFAVLCVMGTFLHADNSIDGKLVAGFTLIAAALLLFITDVVSIVLVYGE